MIKRPRLAHRKIASRNSGELAQLAISLSRSSCRIEDKFWETRLLALVEHLLGEQDEASITHALDQLFSQESPAYGALIDMVEAGAESLHIEGSTKTDVVLIAIPLLAWSRYQIPAGKISPEHLDTLRVHLQAHMLATDTRLCLVDHLFSPDQLPQSYSETHQLLKRLTQAALHGKNLLIDERTLAETAHFLSDTRYVIGAIASHSGQPLFLWQEQGTSREESFKRWQLQGFEALRPLLPACAFELLPPAAYHASIRDADRASRPYSLQAGIDFLTTTLGKSPSALQATIGAYYDRQLEEYRIGFGVKDMNDVLHGMVWPVLDPEDENPEAAAQIEILLRQAGIGQITLLSQQLPMEFCDDCGAPLFPNPEGEPTHAELPEEAANTLPRQLH